MNSPSARLPGSVRRDRRRVRGHSLSASPLHSIGCMSIPRSMRFSKIALRMRSWMAPQPCSQVLIWGSRNKLPITTMCCAILRLFRFRWPPCEPTQVSRSDAWYWPNAGIEPSTTFLKPLSWSRQKVVITNRWITSGLRSLLWRCSRNFSAPQLLSILRVVTRSLPA